MQRKLTDLSLRNIIWGTVATYKRIDTNKEDGIVMVSNLNQFKGEDTTSQKTLTASETKGMESRFGTKLHNTKEPTQIRIFDTHMSALTGRDGKFKQEMLGLTSTNFLNAIDVEHPAPVATKVRLLMNSLESKYGKNIFIPNFANIKTVEQSQELLSAYVDECIKGVIDIFGSNETYSKVVSKNLEELSMDFAPNSNEFKVIQEYREDLINASGENYSLTNNESDSTIRSR